MPHLLLLIAAAFMMTACASDVAGDPAAAALTTTDAPRYAVAPPPTVATDTVPPESTPTPYGMVIEPDSESSPRQLTAKGDIAPAAAPKELLSGIWTNTQDDLEQVELTPTHYKTYYEDEALVEEDMTYHERCPEACSGGRSTGRPCFTVTGPAQTDCYDIVRLTGEVLELRLLGISDETVVYRRTD